MPKIYLSPSFQDHNVGVEDFGTEEMRCNQIADVVERELQKNNNFEVVRNDPEMSLNEVIADSNRNNPDVHFSIHTNAGASAARGCEVYAYKQGTEGDKLAQIVYRRLSEITPSDDRGVKYNSLAETGKTNSIAVLTEVAFHSNEEDANWLINNIELIGTELVKALYEYYNIEYDESTVPTPIEPIEPTNERPLLKKGSKGQSVIELQQILIDKGYNLSKYGSDGSFGTETENAVKELQRDSGIAVDGIIGNDTWEVLNSDFAKPINTYPGYLIKKGQQSEDVRKVQNRLIEKGYNCGTYGADSIFGNSTYNAVVQFQSDYGLSVDGIVGINTWTTLFN